MNVSERYSGRKLLNSLPNVKILDWSKSKAFAYDKINVTSKLNFLLGWTENFAG